jgi:hypothetical protein
MITTNLLLFSTVTILALICYKYHLHLQWKQRYEASFNKRFVVCASAIYLNDPDDNDDNGFTDDPILRKALGKSVSPDQKQISVMATIDLEEVYIYTECTTGKYTDESYVNDSVMVYFKNGDSLLIFETFTNFEAHHTNYLSEKLNY